MGVQTQRLLTGNVGRPASMAAIGRGMLAALALLAASPAEALDLAAMSAAEIAALERRLADAGCLTEVVDGIADAATQAALDRCPLMDPILRIETGRHTAALGGLDVSADGKLLVTGSDDKTARLWRLPEGRVERVLRLPVGFGDEGKVYAVALSRDGSMVAAGGWDAHIRIDGQPYVTLFDAATGAVLRRVGPLPGVSLELAFSEDGRRLAVALGGARGLRVFEAATGQLAFEDTDYLDNVHGLAFDRSGRLATTSYDGNLRLYDPAGKRLATTRTPGGGQPFGVAFSPDGSRVAVGYADSPRLDVFDGLTLRPVFSPDTSKVDNGNLLSVGFSIDGTTLYAAGQYYLGGERPVLSFADGGRGTRSDRRGPQSMVIDLAPFGKRGVIYAGTGPAIGAIDDGGQRILDVEPVTADLSGSLFEHFTVSTDAARVRFGLKPWSEGPVVFDLAELSLVDAPTSQPDLREADTTSLPIEGWEDTTTPTLAGRPLTLEQYEIARALAVLPGEPPHGFLLGADWSVYRFDATGKQIWSIAVPGTVWGVNLSSDGEVAVVAYGDGTVRWHRTSDGAELLALFVHVPDRRWVAWTPSGYYAASPGGEDLIGWHLNRGWEQTPDFFPASRFRDRFYRPDIVQTVLSVRDETTAVRAANAAANLGDGGNDIAADLPPVVALVAPPENAFTEPILTLRYRLRSPSGLPVTALDVLVNGRPLAGERGLVRVEIPATVEPTCPVFDGARGLVRVEAADADLVAGLDCSLTLTLPPEDVEITLIARAGELAGEPATLALVYRGAAAPTEAEIAKPKLYALVIGVSDYELDPLRLNYAAKDARDMADTLRDQAGGLYREVEARLLVDREATVRAVLEGLEWLESEVTSRDIGLLFLAGHGVTDEKQRFYFLPADGNPERLRSTAISDDDIQATIGTLAGKALFFIDACHSAEGLTSGLRRSAADITGVVNAFSSAENGVVMFSSSTGREVSVEDPRWENGAFTEALLEAFSGAGDLTGDGVLSIAEFDLYLSERVKELTGGNQHPVTRKPDIVPDFPVALVMR